MIFMPLANTGWTGECRASVVYSPVALLLIARRDRYKPVGRNAGKNSADGFEAFLVRFLVIKAGKKAEQLIDCAL